MMSTMPPVLTTDPGLSNPVTAFDTGLLPWDGSDLFSIIQSCFNIPVSGQPDPSPPENQTDSNNSGLDQAVSVEKPQNQSSSDNSGSGRTPSELDERKRKRKILNRESAKRSRMRRQRHLENMRNQVSRLKFENKELLNRLRLALYQCQYVRTENDQLRLEHRFLLERLSELVQALRSRQLNQQFAHTSWPRNDTVDRYDPPKPFAI